MTEQSTSASTSKDARESLKTPQLPLLDLSTLDMEKGLLVVNRTKRFVLNVPALPSGGDPLVAPDNTVLKTVPEVTLDASERVVMRNGSLWREKLDGTCVALPAVFPDRGVVFRNHIDNCWQAVRGNGRESIIFTEVTHEQAAQMQAFIDQVGPAKLSSVTVIQKLLTFAEEIGLKDRQNKKTEQIGREMRCLAEDIPGYMIVTKDVQHRAVYIPEGFTAMTTRRPSFPNGAVVLSDGSHRWTIDTEVFLRNFKEVAGDVEIELSRDDLILCTL